MNDSPVKTLGVNLVTDGLNLQFKTKTNKNHTRTTRTEILKRKPGSSLKRQGLSDRAEKSSIEVEMFQNGVHNQRTSTDFK